jgi:hypothetical protein
MTLALGLVALFSVAALLGITAALLSRVGRPDREDAPPASDALLRFFPMAGRHRLPVRGFETAQLVAITVGGVGILLFASEGVALDGDTVFPLACVAASILFGVWWSWRRGVLRPARQTARERERETHG